MATVTHLGQDGRVIDVGRIGWEWWWVRAKREWSGINIATLALGFISRAAARFAVKLKKGQAGGGGGWDGGGLRDSLKQIGRRVLKTRDFPTHHCYSSHGQYYIRTSMKEWSIADVKFQAFQF